MNPAPSSPRSDLPLPRLHPFFRLLICVAGCVAVQVVLGLIVMAFVSVVSTADANIAQQTQGFLQQNFLLLTALSYPPTLIILWMCRRFLDRRSFVSLGLRERGFLGQFSLGTLAGFLACAFIFCVLLITGQVQVLGVSAAAQTSNAMQFAANLAGHLLLMMCVGFFEEVSFRGYAFHNLHRWLGPRTAIGAQAVCFALIHLGNVNQGDPSAPDAWLSAWLAMPNIALFGVFMALCYMKSGSLWFPIAFHGAWNFFLGSVFSFPVSGIPVFRLFDLKLSTVTPLTGGSFGPEASVLLTPVLLALCVVVAQSENSPRAVSDLASLGKGRDEEEAQQQEEETAEEPHENRFKTRMGTQSQELAPDTIATLRELNADSRRLEEERRRDALLPPLSQIPLGVNVQTIGSELNGEAPPPVTPAEPTVIEPVTVAAEPVLAAEAAVPPPSIEREEEKPREIEASMAPPVPPVSVQIPAGPPATPTVTTPPAEAPKKARPKW